MKLLTAAALALLLAGCASGPMLPSYGLVPDFQLTDQGGRAFGSKQLDGQIWIANFIFTNCAGPCPRMSSQFRKLRTEAPGIRFVSFTIDPARDTPEVLAAYGKRFGADGDRWVFLTGTREALEKISLDTFHLSRLDGSFEHSTRFALVDGKRRIRGYYDSSDPEKIRELLADIEKLSKESA